MLFPGKGDQLTPRKKCGINAVDRPRTKKNFKPRLQGWLSYPNQPTHQTNPPKKETPTRPHPPTTPEKKQNRKARALKPTNPVANTPPYTPNPPPQTPEPHSPPLPHPQQRMIGGRAVGTFANCWGGVAWGVNVGWPQCRGGGVTKCPSPFDCRSPPSTWLLLHGQCCCFFSLCRDCTCNFCTGLGCPPLISPKCRRPHVDRNCDRNRTEDRFLVEIGSKSDRQSDQKSDRQIRLKSDRQSDRNRTKMSHSAHVTFLLPQPTRMEIGSICPK